MNVPVTNIVEELRKSTNAVVQKKDVYNALTATQREDIDGNSQLLLDESSWRAGRDEEPHGRANTGDTTMEPGNRCQGDNNN